jgi:hypothetical protein
MFSTSLGPPFITYLPSADQLSYYVFSFPVSHFLSFTVDYQKKDSKVLWFFYSFSGGHDLFLYLPFFFQIDENTIVPTPHY